ncbi:MAG: phage holin family protein [bacterium]
MTAQPQPPTATAIRPAGADASIGDLAKDASTHLSTIIRGEVELAKAEVGASVKNAGTGAVMFGVAAVLLIFSLTFGLVSLAEGLTSLGLWRWLSYLIVFLVLVLLAAIFGYLGLRKVKRIKAPERTIATGRETAAYLKHPISPTT